MKEHPIIFSTEMVNAILDGRKTMTRRIVKPQPGRIFWNPIVVDGYVGWVDEHGGRKRKPCPYGVPGDILWVRETHYRYGRWKIIGHKADRHNFKFVPDLYFGNEVMFCENPPAKIEKGNYRGTGWHKRPSIYMPRSSARILLEITNVRVQRLQDISEEDSVREGLASTQNPYPILPGWKDYLHEHRDYHNPINSFRSLWNLINSKRASWESNPWVWVIEFKKIDHA